MKDKTPYLYFIFLTLLYAFFGTSNANIDSWYYAACVKYSQELLNSHHLLYNVLGLSCYKVALLIDRDIEAIQVLNVMNSLAAGICLLVTYKTLLNIRKAPQSALILTLFCGVCFGFMRYATDAETYTIPILFSLLSCYFLSRSNRSFDLIFSGLFATVSVLFHQLHIWWTLSFAIALFIKKPFSMKDLLLYGFPLFLIPLTYYLAYSFTSENESFIQFITGEYSKGNASLELSLKSFAFTAINLLRTVIQVHGQIFYIFRIFPWVTYIVLTLIVIILIISIRKLRLKRVSERQSGLFVLMEGLKYALIGQTAFALLSSGNAEFMVMLPFLAVLYFHSRFNFEYSLLPVLCLLIWNLFFGIIPSTYLDLNKMNKQVEFSLQNPESTFIWKQKNLIENKITYYKGFGYHSHLIKADDMDTGKINSLLKQTKSIYTDLGNEETGYSRKNFSRKYSEESLLMGYLITPVDSFNNIYGKNYIYRIQALK